MRQTKRYDGLDRFRLVAAAFVVAIHTSPLASFSEGADFFLTRVLARVAVPFFLMVTGQFVAAGCLQHGAGRLFRYLKKTFFLYGMSTLLYLPIGIYAGHYEKLRLADMVRMLFFDGTFYHLWYFPACMTGVAIVYFMSRIRNRKQMFLLAVLLYMIGLGGDSYYGLIEMVPYLADIYEAGFCLFSYTRNGIFMAPLFLLLGVQAAESRMNDRRILWAGLGISFLAMTEEAFLLRTFELQRHDSMYLLLPVVMFFLYKLLLTHGTSMEGDGTGREESRRKRWTAYAVSASAWIYILHPAMIVAVRVIAKAGKVNLLLENSLVHYLAVLVLSCMISFFMVLMLPTLYKNKYKRSCLHINEKKEKRITQNQETAVCCGRAWLEVDRKALHHNVRFLQKRLPDSCKLMPAVKADAYGHGDVLVAKELEKVGIDAFCVACVQEGVKLRTQGIKGMILILGYTHPSQFFLIEKYHLTQTVVDYSYACQLNDYGKLMHVHIGVDTGMHRIGVRSEQLEQILDIYRMEHLAVDGLFTHLCVSDTMNVRGKNYTAAQAEAFYHLVRQMKEHGYECSAIHIQASYGVLNYPKLPGDYARVGIALYGVLSTKEDTAAWSNDLKPVLSLKARIAAVKTLYEGESAGYGIQYTAKQNMQIATLSIGYADGLPRALSCGAGSVLIHGCLAPVIGRICMDQMTVDISGIENVQAGEEAVLIGHSGAMEISVCDIAKQSGTIANEILSRMGARLERVLI